VVGIGFVAVLTAAIAQRFVDVGVSQEIEQARGAPCDRRRSPAGNPSDPDTLGRLRGFDPSTRTSSTGPTIAA